MKDINNYIIEKLNLGKAKVSNAGTDLESFVNVYKVEPNINKRNNNVIHCDIKMDNHAIIMQNKQSVIDFIDNWFSTYQTEYDIDYKFFKFGSHDSTNHIFVKITEKSGTGKILVSMTLYDNIINLVYMDIPEIEEIIFTFLDDIISNFSTNN